MGTTDTKGLLGYTTYEGLFKASAPLDCVFRSRPQFPDRRIQVVVARPDPRTPCSRKTRPRRAMRPAAEPGIASEQRGNSGGATASIPAARDCYAGWPCPPKGLALLWLGPAFHRASTRRHRSRL